VRPTGVRARLFSETGELLGDSAMLSESGRIARRSPAAARDARPRPPAAGDEVADWIARQLSRSDRFPEYVERSAPTMRDFPEAASALRGFNASAVRIAGDGRLLLSAAVPDPALQAGAGRLMLTRDNRAIAASLREVRYDMLTIAVAALGITVLLSLYLAGTITSRSCGWRAPPTKIRLARESAAADPDLGKRGDEIGDSQRRAALDDRGAVAAPHRHRKLRRRRGARAQESADLAALGRRGGGAPDLEPSRAQS
jgi:two-component system sensor histidine kinase ChvG